MIHTGKSGSLLSPEQELIEMEASLLLTFFLCLHNKLISTVTSIRECRCLKTVIHKIDRNSMVSPFSKF